VLRMIQTNDFMTANAVQPARDFQHWKSVADGILSSFERVEAVFYDVTGKPPATVEWL
jgi:GMP synthase PP-ATPase subunit